MRKIAVVLCLDNKNGMTFFGKRQSRDKNLISELVSSNHRRKIYSENYSSILFDGYEGVNFSDNPLEICEDGGTCFIEKSDVTPYLDDIDIFIIYKWNKSYPADKFFTVNLRQQGYTLLGKVDIVGNSHDKITKETYKKK